MAPDLTVPLRDLLVRARATWPEVRLEDETFLPYLAERLPRGERGGSLPRVGDLYLACACAHGHARALAELEREFFPEIARALRKRMHLPATLIDEILQTLRCKLFLQTSMRRGKIAEYSGLGPLRKWLKIAAIRLALNTLRQKKGVDALDSQVHLGPATDPELQYVKERYRPVLERAFTHALERLPERDREVLRHYALEGLSMDQIARLCGVSQPTISAWIRRARTTLIAEARRRITAELGLERSELDSLIRLLRSQLDLSIRALLKKKSL